MAIYVHRRFDKSFKNSGLTDADLCAVAAQVMRGEFEADLGGGVIKKRMALNAGKSGGVRTIVFFKKNNNLFFYDGWSKGGFNKKGAKEIEDDQLYTYKLLAKGYLKADSNAMDVLKQSGTFREVSCDEKTAG
ncbi:type II toxin-antitoxin system RelE/ParE family toxin [Brenneria sp. g21c3]|uniref:type II toxin-antitoxin system RelE/ParE family toxin n=1 Tax=Brenneria sp. g21c3 TaxID=3093893 RepID=UPI002EC1CD26|nr:type II toxin-antitoxin system RelE/ParE family toxin [Brenneria sp. g21c3]